MHILRNTLLQQYKYAFSYNVLKSKKQLNKIPNIFALCIYGLKCCLQL